jgi:hypothetical protein
MDRSELKRPAMRPLCVAFLTLSVAQLMFASAAMAQAAPAQTDTKPSRFVLGPLGWTPRLTLRDAGVDSNVFNSPSTETPKQDVTGSLTPSVDSLLTLGVMQLATQGEVDFLYFERYTNERAINGRVGGRMQFPTTRVHPVLTGSWAHAKDRTGNEIDIRAPRTEMAYSAGLGAQITPGSSLTVTGGLSDLRYDEGVKFQGLELATRLNRQSRTANVAFRSALTPLTKLVVLFDAGRDDFTADPSHNSDNLRGFTGLEFAADAVIRGRAGIGYHKMLSRGSDPSANFAGWISQADLSYTLFGRTRFNVRTSHDTSYSGLENSAYFVSTIGGLEVTHNLVGPIDIELHGSREKLNYTATTTGLPAHREFVDVLGGGLVIRVSTQTRIGFYYDDQQRRSSAGPQSEYSRRHMYTSVTYGF